MGKSVRASDVILAAGGLVWRENSKGRELAIIHRPGHKDWTLPKGKLDPGERWQEAALREVEEETGFDVEIGDFAGSCSYMTRSAPKIVLFWHMRLVGKDRFAPHDPDEVDRLEWLQPPFAIERLSYDRERRVLVEALTGLAASANLTEGTSGRAVKAGAIPPEQGSKLLRWLLQHTSRHS